MVLNKDTLKTGKTQAEQIKVYYALNEKLNSTLCRNLVFHKCADSCSMSYCLLLRSRKRQLCQSLYPEIINT